MRSGRNGLIPVPLRCGRRRSESFETLDRKNEDGRAADFDLERVRHEELAGLHDRRHRIDDLRQRRAVRPDDRHHLVHVGVLDAEDDRRVRLLEEPARAVETRCPELLVEEGVDEGACVLVVDDGDDELHPRSIDGATDPGQRFDAGSPVGKPVVRCETRACQGPSMQEPSMSTDASRDPRASLSRAIAVVADGGDLETVLGGILAVATDALGATMGAIFVSDPDRATLQLVSAHGMTAAARTQLTNDATDPANPFAAAATDRTVIFDLAAKTPDGGDFVGSYLPLMVTTGGVATSVGSLGLSWPAGHILDDAERDTVVALARLAALAVERSRLASTVVERSEWFERMAHTDPLTGLA